MYRFRTVDRLLGDQELEKQYIYFASSDELNDPLEGTRRYFWRGDHIIWNNFLKHYLMCLEHVITLARLTSDERAIQKSDIPIYTGLSRLPTDKYRERVRAIHRLFLSDPRVEAYLAWLAAHPAPIYWEEMFVHLKLLTPAALSAVFAVDRQSGILPAPEHDEGQVPPSGSSFDIVKAWQALVDRPEIYPDVVEVIFAWLKSHDSQLLITLRNSPKAQSIHVGFPETYLSAVVGLTYPNAYIASFTDTCLDSSMWGRYGASHTGVCLEFSETAENRQLLLKTGNGYRNCPFEAVTYASAREEIDFFRNLGRLPVPQLEDQWYFDEDGNCSVCGENILKNQEKWRERYWQSFSGAYLIKTPDWQHEKEHRIVLASNLDSYEQPEDRRLEYRFEDLKSIVFGMRTPADQRAEIVDIVKRKCEALGRSDFTFYEAAYSERRAWHLRELHLG